MRRVWAGLWGGERGKSRTGARRDGQTGQGRTGPGREGVSSVWADEASALEKASCCTERESERETKERRKGGMRTVRSV